MSPSPGQPVEERLISGRYKLIRNLGTGASGTVFLAWDSRDEREVALKILHKDRLGAEGIQALQREFRTLVTLSHSQIAAAHDFGYCDDDETPYFTREFIPGRPLLPGPPSLDSTISPATYLRPIVEVADALHYLHSHEILHLDVHAGNVIEATNPDRGSVLIDFGLMRPVLPTNVTMDLEPSSLGEVKNLSGLLKSEIDRDYSKNFSP